MTFISGSEKFLFLAAVLLLVGCQANNPDKGAPVEIASTNEISTSENNSEEEAVEDEAVQVFEGTGIVKNITPSKTFIVIEHREIEGFMGAMTMPFPLSNESLLEGIEIGNEVDFTLHFNGQDVSVTALKNR